MTEQTSSLYSAIDLAQKYQGGTQPVDNGGQVVVAMEMCKRRGEQKPPLLEEKHVPAIQLLFGQ